MLVGISRPALASHPHPGARSQQCTAPRPSILRHLQLLKRTLPKYNHKPDTQPSRFDSIREGKQATTGAPGARRGRYPERVGERGAEAGGQLLRGRHLEEGGPRALPSHLEQHDARADVSASASGAKGGRQLGLGPGQLCAR